MGCLSLILSLVAGVFGVFLGASSGSETVTASDYQRYADIPQSRNEDGAFILGYADAPLTIIVFEDFFCPHCQELQPTLDEVVEVYVRTGAVRYEWRALATAGGEQLNEVAALLECADIQRSGAFWEGYLLTYDLTQQYAFPQDAAALYAETLKLDETELRSCAETASQYLVDDALADAYGVGGTPGIYLYYSDGEVMPYEGGRDFEDFADLIEEGKNGQPNRENEA